MSMLLGGALAKKCRSFNWAKTFWSWSPRKRPKCERNKREDENWKLIATGLCKMILSKLELAFWPACTLYIYLDGKDVGGGCVNGRGERRKKKNSFTGHESSSPPMTLTVAFHGNGYIIALPD
ncbi:hypothetical protein Tsp_01174 [Trichinella spiralis]|uniref:hypothetical protein n=1 Tax=Trichinella spiralis TaxID=6334 RepID=UPI0001EFC65F|nr:hypothetical protein Tsp_01174 [Trichinella spiralis]